MLRFLLAEFLQHSPCLSPTYDSLQHVFLTWHVSIKVKEKWLWKEKKKKQHSTLEYSDPAIISFLKMTEEKDHIWRKSLYNGLVQKMTRAHAITPPSGARTKSPKETPHKHSICSRLLKMCSVAYPVKCCGSMATNQITWKQVCCLCHGYWQTIHFNSIEGTYTLK